ncbi:hypothetical protein HZF05_07110 [Sphingomonas sp. CGMCC 1.13654]|uniref:Uncharacterized protein n=1 Tax=Sphingomonas chungangi TaxID=2683589 RepID=A0A838L5X7_9SPHN|nr:hypothetical protein [Sphingomonas chungangi]MBA2933869.1 hypothetical protein [Sphingomonas chungangi]MVW55199.1 hypothetical protein [Sphingomonas chungangi]
MPRKTVAFGRYRLLRTPRGGRITYRRTELADLFSSPEYIGQLVPGSVGAAYRDFGKQTGYSAQELADISLWLSSKPGMAMLLDQHVNRSGNVPTTIAQAIVDLLVAGRVSPDPFTWSEADEHRLIEHYLVLRAQTRKTNGQARADQVFAAAQNGFLQLARGAFSA